MQLRPIVEPIFAGQFDKTAQQLGVRNNFPDWVGDGDLIADLQRFLSIMIQASSASTDYEDYVAVLGPNRLAEATQLLVLAKPLVSVAKSDFAFAQKIGRPLADPRSVATLERQVYPIFLTK